MKTESKNIEPTRNDTQQDEQLILEPDDARWLDLLEMDEKGRIKQCNKNCSIVLMHDSLLAGAIKYNELTCGIDIVKNMPWYRPTPQLADIDVDYIIAYMETHYHQRIDKYIERAIRTVANENRYHPIREKLESLTWDGISRLGDVLHHFLGVNQTPLITESLKVFMLGAISRVYTPGCKFEYMLCLVGGQGAGKSSFLKYLAMNDAWFTDDIKQLSDKDIFEHILAHWIVEISEMFAILKSSSIEETKSFLSREKDNYRIKYQKYASDHPRQVVFAGTSNKMQFLPVDKSGNRRFIPIEVNQHQAEVHINADPAYSRSYIEQLWAEVMEIYRTGDFLLTLSRDMQEELNQMQLRYAPEDPMETAIVNYIEDNWPQYICTKMIYEEALGHIGSDPQMWESSAIGEIINNLFKEEYQKISTHRFKAYGRQRGWALVKEPGFRDISPEEEDELPFK